MAEVLDAHAAGLSLRSIAAKKGITLNQAQRLLGEAIATLPTQDIEELRATSLACACARAETHPLGRSATLAEGNVAPWSGTYTL